MRGLPSRAQSRRFFWTAQKNLRGGYGGGWFKSRRVFRDGPEEYYMGYEGLEGILEGVRGGVHPRKFFWVAPKNFRGVILGVMVGFEPRRFFWAAQKNLRGVRGGYDGIRVKKKNLLEDHGGLRSRRFFWGGPGGYYMGYGGL